MWPGASLETVRNRRAEESVEGRRGGAATEMNAEESPDVRTKSKQ